MLLVPCPRGLCLEGPRLFVYAICRTTVECGQISQYNLKAEDRYGLKNFMMVVGRQLTIRGFIVSSIGPKYHEEHQKNVGKWIADGSFKAMLDTKQGIEQSGEALLALFTGANFGKAVVQIAQE